MVKKIKTKEKKSNLISIISLAVIVIALAATVILVQKPQDTRNQAAMNANGECKIIPQTCPIKWGFITIYLPCNPKTVCKVEISNKEPTPTRKPTPTRRPTPTHRPTSTPTPTPITCKSIGGICKTRYSNKTVCPTGYRDIGPYGTCNKSQFCCIPKN